jgi:hypothetical protein
VADFSALSAIQVESQSPGSDNPGKKEQHMKSLAQFVVVAIFAALACTGLHAQSVDMRAEIPFDFHAGSKLMPAGEYVVHGQGPVLWLRDTASGGPAVALITVAASSLERSGAARLDFNRYGNEYFLREVWSSATRDGRQLVPTARQKELAKRGAVPERAEVSLVSTK